MRLRPTSARPGVLALALLALGCRVSLDGSGESDAIAAAPRLEAVAADTVRAACEAARSLVPARSIAMPERVTRLLELDGDLLAVLDSGGVGRVGEGGYVPLLTEGRDFTRWGSGLLGLVEGRIETIHSIGDAPRGAPRFEVEERDVSIAVADGALYVHSPYREADLVVRRGLADGTMEARLLPVERNLVLALLTDMEGLSEDTGIVRGDERRLAFVPWVRDPIAVLDVGSGRWTVLALAGGERGRVRIEEIESSDEQPCPDCTRRVRKRGRRIVRRLYAGAHLDGEAMWVVHVSPPGGRRAALHRIAWGDRTPSIRTWRLEGLSSSPSAVLRRGDEIVIGGEDALHVFDRPAVEGGTPCEVSIG